jgi:microcystin-dependent protein
MDNNKAISLALTLRQNRLSPVGSMNSFAGTIAPDGWLLCDGSNVLRNTYKLLFYVIGITYGNGDGITTFTLPDMRGRVSVAAGNGTGLTNRVLGAIGGEEAHTLTLNEIPSHTHSYIRQDGTQNIVAVDGAGITAADDPTTTVNSGASGGSTAHNVMQPFLVLNHIIKY